MSESPFEAELEKLDFTSSSEESIAMRNAPWDF
jgi:hypothetical protein